MPNDYPDREYTQVSGNDENPNIWVVIESNLYGNIKKFIRELHKINDLM